MAMQLGIQFRPMVARTSTRPAQGSPVTRTPCSGLARRCGLADGAEACEALVLTRSEKCGLQVVTSPGHTPGSISVFDRTAGVLAAGDALRTDGGRPLGPDPRYTDDMAEGLRSVVKLTRLRFETLLIGHGDPIETGASEAVEALAAHA
jgi:glyoxylase-like metal-dependent hydrolase (beta-lactamase superfamily II)